MIETTILTWILLIFGWVFIFLLMIIVNFIVLKSPNSQKTRNIVIGKGENWRDRTHAQMTLGMAWGDLIIWLPFLAIGSIGVIMETEWGYALWLASAAISVYINIILWVTEREYVLPANGKLAYYTFIWGFFIYWGVAVIVYSTLRLTGLYL